ncbi:MAG: DUF3224 domain-containing protein [Dehalococcoidia bacterium]|nr:DUF3224 domain-containing protein [Dehalococcoidia bacterium]
MTSATGSFTVNSWDEVGYEELEGGAKLTEANVTQTFEGALVGQGRVRWLMSYRPDGTAQYVGLQRFEGTLDGRRGSFVAETSGGFDNERARWTLTVIPGTGTDELAGLEGSGTFEAPHGGSASFDFDYQLG